MLEKKQRVKKLKLNRHALVVKTANNKKFKYFQLKNQFFFHYLTEKIEIKRQQLYLLFFYSN